MIMILSLIATVHQALTMHKHYAMYSEFFPI